MTNIKKLGAISVCRECGSMFAGMLPLPEGCTNMFETPPLCPECGKAIDLLTSPPALMHALDNEEWLDEAGLLGSKIGSVGKYGTIDIDAVIAFDGVMAEED